MLFYYSKVFAGGDAKLLFGLGVLLPYESYSDVLILGLGFVFTLFLVGALYSLVYGAFISFRNRGKFNDELRRFFKRYKFWLIFVLVFFVLVGIFNYYFGGVLLIMFFVMIYVLVLDKVMVVEKSPRDLQEGDWLFKDIKIGKKVLKKNVHGLSENEIRELRKARKKVLIKSGVPFVPAFLISWTMGFLILIYIPVFEVLASLLSVF
jgi:vacuolar-type H+-ATPase subunit I/STV1